MTFSLIVKKPMHTVTRVGQVEEPMVNATLQNDVRKAVKGDKATGSANGGEREKVIQTTTNAREVAGVAVAELVKEIVTRRQLR
jgi:hypothetical protein